MSIDFVKALKAPASIEGWGLKLLIGGIIYLVPILNFVTMGYFVEYLVNFMNGKEELPGGSSDNMKTNFITGAKMIVGCLLLGIISFIIVFVISLLVAKLKIVGLIILLLIEIALIFTALFLTMSFAVDKKILSMIDFKRAMMIIKGNSDTLYFILYTLLLFVIYLAIFLALAISKFGIILTPFFSFAMGISMYNLMGQYIQKSNYLAEIKAQDNQEVQNTSDEQNNQ